MRSILLGFVFAVMLKFSNSFLSMQNNAVKSLRLQRSLLQMSTDVKSPAKIDYRRGKSSNRYSNNKGSSDRSSSKFNKDFNQNKPRSTPAVSLANITSPYPRTVILETGKSRLFKDGNPIIYGGAVQEVRGNPKDGDDVHVLDHNGNAIGRGFFNSISQYRVRMIARNFENEMDMTVEDLIAEKLKNAIALRKALSLPSSTTNAYRLVNGEGDQLSGLMVDVFNDIVTIQSSAVWVELHQDIIRSAVKSELGIKDDQIVWKRSENRLQQDGMSPPEKEAIDSAINNEEEKSSRLVSIVRENDIQYHLDPEGDQKTGFYCDQRQNRMLVRSLSKGKRVLDAYCYSGGFAMNAIKGGALSVTAVDSSEKALLTLQSNLLLNTDTLGAENIKQVATIEGDCPSVLQSMYNEGQFFDLVICDPPKLAPTRARLEKATSKYLQVNTLAMQVIAPEGGLLLSCSCSAAMTQSGEFIKVLEQAARQAKRRVTILNEFGAAPDHTIAAGYPEGNYLTAVLVYVQ